MTAALVLLLPLALSTPADDPQWPSFLGPEGSLSIESKALPDTLDPEKTLRWRVEVPGGYSSPIVCGERIFLTATEGKELMTSCLDRKTGEEIWRQPIPFHGKRPGANSAAAPTPVTDGEILVSTFHDLGMIAYDLNGEELWSRPIDPPTIPHGFSSSPIIHGGLVVLQVDQDSGSYVIACDKKSGDLRWKVDRPGQTHGYGSPALYVPEEGPAQVILSGAMRISSHSLEDGKLLWWVDGSAQTPMSSPIVLGDLCIVCAYSSPSTESGLPNLSGTFEAALAERDKNEDGLLGPDEFDNAMIKMAFFVFDLDDDGFFDEQDWNYVVTSCQPSGGLFSIELGGKGDVTESHVLWKYDGRRGLAEASSPLLLDDRIFLLKSGSLLSTFDLATGELDRMERVGAPDQYWASPVVADGKIYLASLSGQLTVLTASPEWEVLSTTDLGEPTWSTPAIADDQIFVRTQKALYCFGLPEEE